MVVSPAELDALSPAERRALANALLESGCGDLDPLPVARNRRRWFLRLVGIAQAVLLVWIVYLGTSLPDSENASMWRTAWVGFDIALLASFAVCGWAAWRGRQLLIPATLVTGTLLFCDAWFDVLLSWGSDDRWWAVASAALVEIPLAVTFWGISRRAVRRTVTLARARMGLAGETPSLSAMTLFDPLLVPRPEAAASR